MQRPSSEKNPWLSLAPHEGAPVGSAPRNTEPPTKKAAVVPAINNDPRNIIGAVRATRRP